MPQSGDPQTTDIHVLTVPCDSALETTPLIVELCLLACPTGANMQMEILSVGFRANTLAADTNGDGTILVDIEYIDDSASDAVTNLATNVDLETATQTVLIYNELWRGSQILDPGDVINVEFTTDGTLTTASEGAAFIVEYRVRRHS